MQDSFESVRDEHAVALEQFQAAAKAIEEFDAEAEDAPDFDSLKATFDESEVAYTAATEKFELAKRTKEALEVAIPDVQSGRDVRVNKEPLTYERNSGNSIFTDMYRCEVGVAPDAAARLARHTQEMRHEQPEKFDLSSTDSAGGHLVAPLYLNEEFGRYARVGRPIVDAIGARPLPPNTDSIVIPAQDGGVSVAAQTDNVTLSETDATFTSVTAAVVTIAGVQDASQQLVDRSVPGIDDVIFGDLVAAYSADFDSKVLNSTTSNSEGLLAADSTNTTTYTQATPTTATLYPKLADAIQEIHTNLFMPPDAVFMHPRRWGSILASVDSSNRPLVLPAAQVPQNAVAGFGGVVSEGLVGSIQGLPVFVSANIPTTDGSGTNEDKIIVLRRSESYVWEDTSGPYLETFRDVLSGQLAVRFRLHNYVAQQHERRPKSISLISGTGLAAPSF